MPWCPSCKKEYDKGIKRCPLCDERRVRKLPQEYDTAVYLTTADDSFEANIIISLLESYQIPVLKKHKHMGEYIEIFTGSSNFGIDLYVPSRALSAARDILADRTDEEPDGQEAGHSECPEKKSEEKSEAGFDECEVPGSESEGEENHELEGGGSQMPEDDN